MPDATTHKSVIKPHQYSSGPRNSAGYMSSGSPWITGSYSSAESAAQAGVASTPGGMHLHPGGWDNGASSSLTAGAFRVDGDAASDVTAAEIHVKFPYVTKSFEIIQSGSGVVRVHFRSIYDADGAKVRPSDVYRGNHYIQLDGDEESFEFNVKTKEVYISGIKNGSDYPGFQLIANLTNIPTGSMHRHSGSGITQYGPLVPDPDAPESLPY